MRKIVAYVRSSTYEERLLLANFLGYKLDLILSLLGVAELMLLISAIFSKYSLIYLGFAALVWLVFVADFVLRASIAPSGREFVRENKSQLWYLIFPFIRIFHRKHHKLVLSEAEEVAHGTLAFTKGAVARFSNRAGLLTVITLIIIFGSANLLVWQGTYGHYSAALHDTAYVTLTGEPLSKDSALAHCMEIFLSAYSVIILAALAAMLGAYFLEKTKEPPAPPAA